MARYVSQALTVCCGNLDELREFLCQCRAVSDQDLFGRKDYWQPPEQFEKRKAGDCEDFSLWTWRQLLMMEYDARVVFGKHRRYGIGHAWVTFFRGNKCFLMEPQAAILGLKLPPLSTLSYEPKFSVAWDGRLLRYYAHRAGGEFHAPLKLATRLLPEWVDIWSRFWLKFALRFPSAMASRVRGGGRKTGGRFERL